MEIQPFLAAIPLSFAALFPVVNPVGTAAILLGLTRGATYAELCSIARAIAINSVLLLSAVLVSGHLVLRFFGISVPIVQLAGGLVLAAMGWKMLFGDDDTSNARASAGNAQAQQTDYSKSTFYPFTFPLTVGPGCVAVAITLGAHASQGHVAARVAMLLGALVGIAGVGVSMYFAVVNAGRMAERLGANGLSVLTRLSAFIIVCLGAQISWTGVRTLVGPWFGPH